MKNFNNCFTCLCFLFIEKIKFFNFCRQILEEKMLIVYWKYLLFCGFCGSEYSIRRNESRRLNLGFISLNISGVKYDEYPGWINLGVKVRRTRFLRRNEPSSSILETISLNISRVKYDEYPGWISPGDKV